MAALFHDLGKPSSHVVGQDGIDHFYRHEEKSNDIFQKFAKKYKVDKKTIEIVSKIILNHDRELSLKRNKMIKFIKSYGTKEEIEYLFAIKKADILAQNPTLFSRLALLEKTKDKYEEMMNSVPTLGIKDLNINGKQLIKMGFFDKNIGIILRDILDKVTLNQLVNEKEELEEYVTKNYK